jgi:hypothetical protein
MLPETIAVRHTEEEAGYISVRPVVRETFRIDELAEMILSVTGKDAGRILQIMKGGTLVFHDYRYWWSGFAPQEGELAGLLEKFPDALPERKFQAHECVAVRFESGGQSPGRAHEMPREALDRKRLLPRRSFWRALMEEWAEPKAKYREYSYEQRADLFAVALTKQEAVGLARRALELLPRKQQGNGEVVARARQAVFVCPRAK